MGTIPEIMSILRKLDERISALERAQNRADLSEKFEYKLPNREIVCKHCLDAHHAIDFHRDSKREGCVCGCHRVSNAGSSNFGPDSIM